MKDAAKKFLDAKGDRFITWLLVCIALFLLYIALFTDKLSFKEAVAAWVLVP